MYLSIVLKDSELQVIFFWTWQWSGRNYLWYPFFKSGHQYSVAPLLFYHIRTLIFRQFSDFSGRLLILFWSQVKKLLKYSGRTILLHWRIFAFRILAVYNIKNSLYSFWAFKTCILLACILLFTISNLYWFLKFL